MTEFIRVNQLFPHYFKSVGFYIRLKRRLPVLMDSAFYDCHFSKSNPKIFAEHLLYARSEGRCQRCVNRMSKMLLNSILWEVGSTGFAVSPQAFHIPGHSQELLFSKIFYCFLHQQKIIYNLSRLAILESSCFLRCVVFYKPLHPPGQSLKLIV